MVVTGTYDPYLVALSILVAAFASYTALDLGGRVAAARGLARRLWLAAAGQLPRRLLRVTQRETLGHLLVVAAIDAQTLRLHPP